MVKLVCIILCIGSLFLHISSFSNEEALNQNNNQSVIERKANQYYLSAREIKKQNADSALSLILKASDLLKNEKGDILKATIYNEMGVIYVFLSDFINAEIYANKSTDIIIDELIPLNGTQAEYLKLIADNIKTIGTIFYYKSEYDSALIYLDRSKDYYMKANDSIGIVQTYITKGAIEYIKNEYIKSIESYQSAMPYLTDTNDLSQLRQKAKILNNIALTYTANKEFEKAFDIYKESLFYKLKDGNVRDIGNTYNNLGLCRKQQADDTIDTLMKNNLYEIAIEYYQKAIQTAKASRHFNLLANANQNIGNIYLNLRKSDMAIPYLKEAEQLYSISQDKRGLCHTYNTIAKAIFLISEQQMKDNPMYYNFDLGIEYSQKAYVLSKELSIESQAQSARQLLSQLYELTNEHQKAIIYIKEYYNIEDSIKAIEKEKAFKEIVERYQAEKNTNKILKQKNEINILTVKSKNDKLKRNLYATALLFSVIVIIFIGIIYRRKRKNLIIFETKNKEIEDKNKHINLLMSELNHRVMNNIQLVSSMLNISASSTDSREAKLALEESRNRMISISFIHRLLLMTEESNRINLKDYIGKLVEHLSKTFSQEGDDISAEIEELLIPAEKAAPIGLIVNELITNCFKHSNTSINKEIKISILRINSNKAKIIVYDNGHGIEGNLNLNNATSFGMNLVKTLVKQLDGEIKIYENKGNFIEIIVTAYGNEKYITN